MQPGALRALEFDRIVEAVRGLALTPHRRGERLAACGPRPIRRRVASCWPRRPRGCGTSTANAPFPLRAPSELETILAALAVEGRALEPLRLLAFADFLESVDQTRGRSVRNEGDASRC